MFGLEQSKGKRTALYALSYVVGVGWGTIIDIHIALLSAILLALGAAGAKRARWVLWAAMWCAVGITHSAWMKSAEPSSLDHRLGQQEITGTITREVEHRRAKQRVVVADQESGNNILVWLPPYPRVYFGDTIHTECTLARPKPFEGFAYDEYLKTQGIWYECNWARDADILTEGNPSLKRTIFVFKKELNARMHSILPEPHASFLAGILYGDRGGLSQEQQQQFAQTGTSHILAVSGYNITIITATALALLASMLVPRKRAVWIVLGVVALFALLVGSQASVMRAAIMGMVPLFARLCGRLTQPIYVLIHAATVMVVLNPRILVYDPGFQLSIAATAGLILLTPRMLKQAEWMPDIMSMRDAALATIAATIATIPLSLYHFGQLSLVSVPVNVLVVPLIPLIMGSGMLMLIALAIHPALAIMVGSIPYTLMSLVLGIIEFAARIPLSVVGVRMNGWMVVIAYLILLKMFIARRRRPTASQEQLSINNEVWIVQERSQ